MGRFPILGPSTFDCALDAPEPPSLFLQFENLFQKDPVNGDWNLASQFSALFPAESWHVFLSLCRICKFETGLDLVWPQPSFNMLKY